MVEVREAITKNSNRIITKLQLLSQFFEDELVFKIYVRTQVIQKLFENNEELDIHKLELFHLQFTESIIELLKKIKKNNEKTVCSIEEEIRLNEELVHSISNTMRLEESFEAAKEAHTLLINKALFKLYQNLSGLSADAPFPKDIDQFNAQFAKDFFAKIPVSLVEELTEMKPDRVYKNGYGTIEKKLMGLQCKYDFKNTFYCGLKASDAELEIYKLNITDKDEYFLFYPDRYVFASVPFSKIESINLSEGISKKAKIIHEITAKNVILENDLPAAKTNLPENVVQLLTEYYAKISALDFLDFIDDFDIQANVLKTMLNTEGF